MTRFNGFSAGQSNTISIHARFISEVVPMIDDLAELKVSLFSYFALTQKEGQYRYLTRADFANNSELMQGLALIEDKPELVLDEALNKAVNHGFLLMKTVQIDAKEAELYFMNTARSKVIIAELMLGKWQPELPRFEILPDRANVYQLYEKNIGMLTASIAEDIKEAEEDYPHDWLVEAIELAVTNNVRKWNYISKILDKWHSEGKTRIASANIELRQLYQDNFDYKLGSVMEGELAEAQQLYQHDWIVDAMKLAVTNNVKRWTYVKSILAHWQQDGRGDTAPDAVIQFYRENFDYNIGTVMRAELEEAQSNFEEDWILDAMKIALKNNVKRWTYVRIILERWKQEGRSDVNEESKRFNQRTDEYAGLSWSDFTSE